MGFYEVNGYLILSTFTKLGDMMVEPDDGIYNVVIDFNSTIFSGTENDPFYVYHDSWNEDSIAHIEDWSGWVVM